EFAKTTPGGLKIGTSGAGGAGHLSAEVLMDRLGIKDAKFVHYRGESPSMLALLAGTVDIAFAVSSPDPDLMVLATTAAERWSSYPAVPPIAEQGVAGYASAGWAAVAAPAGTPAEITGRIEAALKTVLADPETQAAIRRRGAEPSSLLGQDFRDQMK